MTSNGRQPGKMIPPAGQRISSGSALECRMVLVMYFVSFVGLFVSPSSEAWRNILTNVIIYLRDLVKKYGLTFCARDNYVQFHWFMVCHLSISHTSSTGNML